MEELFILKIYKGVLLVLKEFKDFINKGNVIDLAVAVIIGGAFGKIVSSIVDDLIMPVLGIIVGGIDFTILSVGILDAQIMYGNFLQAVINFLIIAGTIFIVIRQIKKFEKKEEEVVEEEVAPEPSAEEVLLTEIRDLLKNK